jgi:hypothetical protein
MPSQVANRPKRKSLQKPAQDKHASAIRRFWLAIAVIASAQSVLAICIGIGELTCDQRIILRLDAGLVAGVIASALFSGDAQVRIAGKLWSLRAKAGFAAFFAVFILSGPIGAAVCAAPDNGIQAVDVSGRVEVGGSPAGIVTIHFDALRRAVITAPDGSFAVRGIPIGATLSLRVEYHQESIPFKVERPYATRKIFVTVDLAAGVASLRKSHEG